MTFANILADVYRRTGFASSPASDVVTRIKAFVNETQQEILATPGLEVLARNQTTFASVADRQTYGIGPGIEQIQRIWDTTNNRLLTPMSVNEYRSRFPDPSETTGTPIWWVPLEFGHISIELSDASQVFADSDNAGDTNTLTIRGVRTGGFEFEEDITMTGETAVGSAWTTITQLTKVYLDVVAVGTVTLSEDAEGGTVLATIPPGATSVWNQLIALVPTPSAAVTYNVEGERLQADLVKNTDEPQLPRRFHRLLAVGARMKEYEKTDDTRYALAAREFAAGMKQLRFWAAQQAYGSPNLRGYAGDHRPTPYLPILIP